MDRMWLWTLGLAVTSLACGPKYPSDCKGAELGEPWKGLGLRVEEGRVCSADGKKAELLFPGTDEARWAGAVEQQLVAAGYPKDSCASGYCTYKKDKKSPYVQMIKGERSDGKRKWVRLSLVWQGG
ncbi:MAG: hypothetical protein IT373_14105 [Polyangiaceae bacterium]|nr:hypothetical protein [Polyangiaceae bacterium]